MSKEFDSKIEQILGETPEPETKINSLTELSTIQLSENDKKTFSLLYSLKPTTIDGRENNNTIGNGEIAVYWLLKYNSSQQFQSIITNSKYNSKLPDLQVNGTGIEVKAYENNPRINLGRLSQAKHGDLLEMLNISYTLSTISEYDSLDKRVYYSTLSVNPSQLIDVFKNVINVKNNVDKWKDKLYGKNIQIALTRLESIYSRPLSQDPVDLNKFFISELVKSKLEDKPGLGGFIINTQSDGNIKAQQITESFLRSQQFQENCVKYATSYQGSVIINMNNLFEASG
jgi:hypothetical protein